MLKPLFKKKIGFCAKIFKIEISPWQKKDCAYKELTLITI